MTPDTNTPPPLDASVLDVVLTHPETARMLRLSIRSLDRLRDWRGPASYPTDRPPRRLLAF